MDHCYSNQLLSEIGVKWDCKLVESESKLHDIIKFAMADLLSLPFEMHVLTVRELSFKDCSFPIRQQICNSRTASHKQQYRLYIHKAAGQSGPSTTVT